MCEDCPNAKSIQDPNQFSLLSDLIANPAEDEDYDEPHNVLTCKACGYTEEKLKRSGRLGCQHCYDTFSQSIDSMIVNMHKGSIHIGKVPASHQQNSYRQKLLQLEADLQTFIQEEAYEKAAQTRDQIAALKKDMRKD